MPLTYEEARELATLKGFNPDEVDVNAITGDITPRNVKPQPTMAPGVPKTTAAKHTLPETVVRNAALSVVPSAVSLPASIAIGAKTTAAFTPVMGPWAAIPGFVAAVGAGMGIGGLASAAQEKVLENVEGGKKFLAETKAASEENPIAATVGHAAGSWPMMHVNPVMLKDAAGAVVESRMGAGLGKKFLESPALQQVAIGGGLGAAGSVYEDIKAGHDVNIPKALVSTALQAALSDVRPGAAKVIPGLKGTSYEGQRLGNLSADVMVPERMTRTEVVKPPASAEEAAKLKPEIEKLDAQIAEYERIKKEQESLKNDIVVAQAKTELAALKKQKAALDEQLSGKTRTVEDLVASDELRSVVAAKAAEKGVETVTQPDTGKLGKGQHYGEFSGDGRDIVASTYAGREGTTNLPEGLPGAATTGVHETFHSEVYNILEGKKSQKDIGANMQKAVEASPEGKQAQAAGLDWEEAAVIASARRIAEDPSNANRSLKNEWAATSRLKNGTASFDDVVTVLTAKWRYDRGLAAPRGARGGGAKHAEPFDSMHRAVDEAVAAQKPTEQNLPMSLNPGNELTRWLHENAPDLNLSKGGGEAPKAQSEFKFSTAGEEGPGRGAFETQRNVKREDFFNKHANHGMYDETTKSIRFFHEPNTWSTRELADWFGVTPSAIAQFAQTKGGGSVRTTDWNTIVKDSSYIPINYPSMEVVGQGAAGQPLLKARRDEQMNLIMKERPLNEKLGLTEKVEGDLGGENKQAYLQSIISKGVRMGLMPNPASGQIARRGVTRKVVNEGVDKWENSASTRSYVTDVTGRVLRALETEGVNLKAIGDKSFDEQLFQNSARIAKRFLHDDAMRLEERLANEGPALQQKSTATDKELGDVVRAAEPVVAGKRASTKLTAEEQAKLSEYQAAKAEQEANAKAIDINPAVVAKPATTPKYTVKDWLNAWDAVLVKYEVGDLDAVGLKQKSDKLRGELEKLGMKRDEIDDVIQEGLSKVRGGEDVGGESGTKTEAVRYSTATEDQPTRLVTTLSKEVAATRPFGLQLGKDGKVLTSELLGKLKTLPPAEQELLERAGLKDWLAPQSRVSGESVAKWLDENGPKVEVKSYGMEGKVSEAKREYDRMTHEWFDGLSQQDAQWVSQIKAQNEPYRSQAYEQLKSKWTPEMQQQVKKYIDLNEQVVKQPRDTSPRATSAYETVSAFNTREPMPEWTTSKEGRNVQRVDVVIPHNEKLAAEAKDRRSRASVTRQNMEREAGIMWSPDNLHENLPNTLGWAMIQYKTGPKGEKIAVVVEAQSRWGQELRNSKALEKPPEGATAREYRIWQMKQRNNVADHPLLRDYNRLILKAAIDQARKEGATHMVVSDAETAMMTEGHDAATSSIEVKASSPDAARAMMIARDIQQGRERAAIHSITESRPGYYKVRYAISQEPGMRLNYDKVLPKIAEELTGVKGERVSLGEHKNAFTIKSESGQTARFNTAEEAEAYARGRKATPRENLVFQNPDGTPKTDVSGVMYDISAPATRLQSGEPMTMAGKRYSTAGADVDLSKQGPIERFAAQFDQVRKYDTQVADALARTEVLREVNEGQFLHTPVSDFSDKFGKASEMDLKAAYDYALRKWREDATLDENTYTKRQKDMATFWNERISRPVRELQNELGLKVENRAGDRRRAQLSEWYAPEMLNDKAIDVFTKSTDTAEVSRLKQKWIDHVVKESATSDKPVSAEDAAKEIGAFIRTLGSRGSHVADFGALRKSSGFGLPPELRETNLMRVMQRYARRASRDLAKVEGLGTDKYVRDRLGIEDPETGEVSSGAGDLLAHEEVRGAMQFINGDFESNRSPRLLATSRVATNLILGPLSGARDAANVIVNSTPHMKPSDVPLFLTTLADFSKNRRKSLEVGARTGTHPLDRIDHPMGTDWYVNLANTVAEGLRKYSGRDAIEQFNRIWAFGVGRELAIDAVIKNDKKFLAKFGYAALKDGKWNPDIIAKNFSDRNQGTYGGRGLPASAVDGAASPWFSLARWSLEKANTTWNDVLKPAYTGESIVPLLSYTAGAWLTGKAIEKLNEEFQAGKRSRNPTAKEVEATGDTIEQNALRLANVMQLGSFLGMTGDLMKAGADIYSGEMPRGYSVPLADLISDGIVGNLSKFTRAMHDGADPIDAAKNLVVDLSNSQIQAVRVGRYWLDRKETERSNKFRDLRVFDKLTGRALPTDAVDSNPALRADERKFKRSETPEESVQLLGEILQRYKTQYADNPEALKKSLDRLKQNSYQTFPSPERNPQHAKAYYDYLTQVFGKEEADARFQDYARQTTLNRAKTTAIPTL